MSMNPEIILGAPGCGKTTHLLGLVEVELERGVPPDRIGYISFTRKAAEEARDRAMVRFNLKARQLPWFRTIHSLCFASLGMSSSEVFEGKKLAEFGDSIGVRISGKTSMEEGASFGFETGDRCLFMENLARVKGIPLRQQYEINSDDLPWAMVEHVSKSLESYKRSKGLLDFTDMIVQFTQSEWSARLEVLFVDEAQDLSMVQWKAVEKLAQGARRVLIAGDDDQAIYQWAGAAVDHFVNLPGQEKMLEQSWRVPSAIQSVALDVLARVKQRRAKAWTARAGDPGVVRRVSSLDELDFHVDESTLILARNTCFITDDAVPLLRQEGVIYGFRGGTSVRQSLVNAILDWERLRKGEALPVEVVEKVYEQMASDKGYKRGNKKLPAWQDREQMVTLEDLKEAGGLLTDAIWHEALDRISPEERVYMLKALRKGEDKRLRKPSVNLSTIHGSKGGEADHVILLRDVAWRTYVDSDRNQSEDEARCWYVAATRARKTLTIVEPQTRRERAYGI